LSYDKEEESVVDWASPLLYDIYTNKEEPLENVISRIILTILLMRVLYIMCLMKALKVKSLIWMLTKLISMR